MAGWALALAAAGFWTGILLAGMGSGTPGGGEGAAFLVLGGALIFALGVTVRRRHQVGSPEPSDRPAETRGARNRMAIVRLAVAGVVGLGGVAAPFVFVGAGWEDLRRVHLAASPLA